jgi:hypothetical protein
LEMSRGISRDNSLLAKYYYCHLPPEARQGNYFA